MGVWTFICLVAVWVLISLAILVRFPCKCGRQRMPYFSPTHEKPMWIYVALWIGLSIWDLATWELLGEGIALLWLAFYSLRWYYHEKDKVKKTLKALGRVRVNHHGRLVVVKN
jgi:hypothetical protein